ncbi:MAG: DUF2240 family protein, partial [Euryarchaeota archaeon]|nr:DUF2240 family protein [Euryarchaeota archaeon]
TEETKTALAALFRMRGRDAISESEFVLDASMKLRWFSPKDAQRLLQAGLDHGLLRAEAGNVRITFDPAGIDVPVNYRPGPEAFAMPKVVDLFARILERVRAATGEGTQPIVARINEVQEKMGVEAEVAAAHVATSRGVDVSDLWSELEAEVLRRSG